MLDALFFSSKPKIDYLHIAKSAAGAYHKISHVSVFEHTGSSAQMCTSSLCCCSGNALSTDGFRAPCSVVCFLLHHNWLQQEMVKLPQGRRTVPCHQGQSTDTCGIQASAKRELAEILNPGSWASRFWDVPGWRDSDCGMEEKEPWKVVPVVSQFPESKVGLPQSRHYCPTKQQTCQRVT